MCTQWDPTRPGGPHRNFCELLRNMHGEIFSNHAFHWNRNYKSHPHIHDSKVFPCTEFGVWSYPCSMYGIFTNNCHVNNPNVGRYTIHGAYGSGKHLHNHGKSSKCFCNLQQIWDFDERVKQHDDSHTISGLWQPHKSKYKRSLVPRVELNPGSLVAVSGWHFGRSSTPALVLFCSHFRPLDGLSFGTGRAGTPWMVYPSGTNSLGTEQIQLFEWETMFSYQRIDFDRHPPMELLGPWRIGSWRMAQH